MDFTVNKKNLKDASFVDFEMKYDSVIIPYEKGNDRYPVVRLVQYSDNVSQVPVTNPIMNRPIGTYLFEYFESNGKWRFEGNYYTKEELVTRFGVFYWILPSSDSEKNGDKIYVYVVKRREEQAKSYSVEYKRTGKIYYTKKRLGSAPGVVSGIRPSNIGLTSSGPGLIARMVIGKEPYSYRFEGLVYPPYLTVSDTIKYGGKVYGNGNTTLKFGPLPVATIEYPEAGEAETTESATMTSTDASVARDVLDYETVYSMVRGFENTHLPRNHNTYNTSNSSTQWSLQDSVWDVYIGRIIYELDGDVVTRYEAVKDLDVLHIAGANDCYFGGNVWAGKIKAGIVNGENRGYISGGEIDASIGTANCDSGITTPLARATSHQNTLSGSVKNYTPWFNYVYVGDDKIKFVPKEITYKDENGVNQTITVLAQETS